MKSPNYASLHRTASQNLEASLRHYEEVPAGLAREFVELKLQATIFQYDICAEMVSFARNKPTGFAAAVALKGLVLRLYEYDKLQNTSFIPRLLELSAKRGIAFDRASIKVARVNWKKELTRLKKWSTFRNEVAGHYGKDLRAQIALLKSLDPEEVMSVTKAFLSFNMALLQGLADAGKGVAHAA
ncbi:MAG: hypothetical protein H7Z15_03990 [Rhizobacter sp.]|nr:hypothetical protein [Rhizobacter sp.]